MDNRSEAVWAELREVENRVLQKHFADTPLHRVMFISAFFTESGSPELESNVFFVIFYHTDKDIQASYKNGTNHKIFDSVRKELDKINRGPKSGTRLTFLFDSDENVKRTFGGEYKNWNTLGLNPPTSQDET